MKTLHVTLKTLIISTASILPLALAPMASAAAPAAAASPNTATIYTIQNDYGRGYFINDPGIGNIAKTTSPVTTYFTLDTSGQPKYDGHTTFKLRVNGGSDCLQSSSNTYIYDEGCNTNGTNQQFYHVDDYLYSVGLQNLYGTPVALEAVSATNGSQIFGDTDTTANELNQWDVLAAS